jgi:hypothetical protein
MPRPGAPIVYSVERMAALCHTLLHFDHWRLLSTHTTRVSTSPSWPKWEASAIRVCCHKWSSCLWPPIVSPHLENNLADLHHAAGRPQESMEHLKRAVAIFSEVGADEAARLPEIWKLVSW